jgi:hypothetical protein
MPALPSIRVIQPGFHGICPQAATMIATASIATALATTRFM